MGSEYAYRKLLMFSDRKDCIEIAINWDEASVDANWPDGTSILVHIRMDAPKLSTMSSALRK